MAIIERPNDLAQNASKPKALPILSEHEITEHLRRPEVIARLERVERIRQSRRAESERAR